MHQLNDHGEVELERNAQNLAEPGDSEECNERDEQSNDREADRVYSLLDLVLVTSREDEGNTTDDDENETEERRHYQRKRDERRDDLDGAALLEQLLQHEWVGERGMKKDQAMPGSMILRFTRCEAFPPRAERP